MRFIRFGILGCISTVITYTGSYILLYWFSYLESYAISYSFSLIISIALNQSFVFKKRIQASSSAVIACIYISQYMLSSIALYYIHNKLGLEEKQSLLLVVILFAPYTYILIRWVLK